MIKHRCGCWNARSLDDDFWCAIVVGSAGRDDERDGVCQHGVGGQQGYAEWRIPGLFESTSQ